MKKTILTIMVAAMMLVAFTACEQQPIDVLGYEPTTVAVSQNGTIITGQTITPDMFTATVTYANGQTGTVAVEISADQKTATATVNEKISNTVNVVTTDATGAIVEATTDDVTVDEDAADEVAVTIDEVTSITLTAGDASWVLPESYIANYTVTADSLTAEQAAKVGAYDVALTIKGKSSQKEVPTESTVTVNVVPEDTPDTAIASLRVAVVKSTTVSAGDEPVIISNPWLDESTVAVIGYNAAGEYVKILETTEYTLIGDAFPTTGNNLPLGTTASPALTGMVYLASDNSINVSYSLSGRDYVKSIALENATVTKAGGTQFTIADVGKVTATTASGATRTVTATTTPISIPANAETGSLTATVTYVNEKGDDVPATVTITVTKAAN